MKLRATGGGGGDDGLTPRQRLEPRLEKCRWPGEKGTACCPAHNDRNPSLSLRELPDGRVLVNCFTGCSPDDIVTAVGLEMRDLFPAETPLNGSRPSRASQEALGMARTIVSVLEADRAAGKALSDFDKASARQAVETLRAHGEDVEFNIDPLPPTLTEFMKLEFPPMVPVLGPFMTQQLTLMFAPTGAGKTMLGFSMAYTLSEGQDFLGWECPRPRKVLYLDGEMAGRMVQERFTGCESENLYFVNVQTWWLSMGYEPLNLVLEAHQNILADWIERTGVEVVFLDNFMTLAWAEGVSFSSDEVWTPVRRFALLLRGQGKTVFIVDHANDQGRVFGTKTKEHQVDLTVKIEPIDPEDEVGRAGLSELETGSPAVIHFGKKRGFSDSDPLLASRRITIGQIGKPWKWEIMADVLLEKVKVLRQNGLSIREIAKELQVSYSKIQRLWKRHQMTDSG